uniref:F-box family protein n=1 Tax=Solanum tuberosum TaxID=4113 RepID=M1BDH1_SOLTU
MSSTMFVMAADTLSDSDQIFSKLPEDIIEKILSYVTMKQRPIVSLISKKWQQIIKSFNDDLNLVHKYSAKIACGYCGSSQLDRHASCLCSDTDLYHVDPFIKLAADNISFKELYLFIPPTFRYCASPGILDSKFLTILHIKGNCNMNIIRKFNVMPSLKELYFHSVCIFSHAFSNFIPKCPLLVLLTLINCDNLNELTVPHLNYLEKLHVTTRKKITKIEVKAQNLLEFHLCCPAFTKLDLSASTKLQLLHIDSTNVPDSFPHEICSTFPSLKSLCLILCRGLKKIKIVSPLLESLTLNNIIDLDEAFIATPNLQLFNVIYSFKFQTPCPIVGSRQMEVEMGARATNNLLELRTFAENLGENITLSLETDTTGAKTLVVTVNSDARKHDFLQVLMNELECWNRDGTKRYKRSEYIFWYSALKRFTVLGSTAFARQEKETRCDRSTLCAGSGEGSNQKGLSVDLPNISSITKQEREARNGKRPLCAGSEEGREQQCILFIALPNLSTITREGAHQIKLQFEW